MPLTTKGIRTNPCETHQQTPTEYAEAERLARQYNETLEKQNDAIREKIKPTIHLCERHYRASSWDDKDVILTGRQSCDICEEKDA